MVDTTAGGEKTPRRRMRRCQGAGWEGPWPWLCVGGLFVGKFYYFMVAFFCVCFESWRICIAAMQTIHFWGPQLCQWAETLGLSPNSDVISLEWLRGLFSLWVEIWDTTTKEKIAILNLKIMDALRIDVWTGLNDRVTSSSGECLGKPQVSVMLMTGSQKPWCDRDAVLKRRTSMWLYRNI